MCRLFETIKYKNGELFNLKWHNQRLNRSRKACFGSTRKLNLAEIITVPEIAENGLFRCRITYSDTVEEIEFIPHQFREVKRLKLVENNTIDYRFKYTNRKLLQKLFIARGNYDDILIVKNGLITDTSTANTIFFDGEKWWTPNLPLLPGTQREKLLAEKKITECKIILADLKKYERVGLINAMWDFKNMPIVEIDKVL